MEHLRLLVEWVNINSLEERLRHELVAYDNKDFFSNSDYNYPTETFNLNLGTIKFQLNLDSRKNENVHSESWLTESEIETT